MGCMKLIFALLSWGWLQACTATQSIDPPKVEQNTGESVEIAEKKPSSEDQNEDDDISVPGEIVGDGKPITRDGMISTPEYIGSMIYPDFGEALGKKFEGFEFKVCEEIKCSKEENAAFADFIRGDFSKECKAQDYKLIFIDCCGPSWCTGLPEKGN